MTKAPHVVSEFGYWIDPYGGIHAMKHRDSHGSWVVACSGIPAPARGLPADVTDGAIALAIDAGWIAVFAAEDGVFEIKLRRGAVDKRAGRALRQLLTEHQLLDTHLRCSRGDGLGKDIARAIVISGRNGEKFPDPNDELASLLRDLDRLRRNVAQRDFCVAALAEGRVPDFSRLADTLRAVDQAAQKARADIRAYDFGPSAATEATRAYAEELCDSFEGHAATIEALVGDIMLAFVSAYPSEVGPIDDGLELTETATVEESIRAVGEAVAALERRSSPYAGLSVINGASKALQDAAVRASALKAAPGLILRYVAEFRKQAALPDVTGKRVEEWADFLIAHECGRTLQNIQSSYLRDLRNALGDLRVEMASSASPSPQG
jgi:hypothetical protein